MVKYKMIIYISNNIGKSFKYSCSRCEIFSYYGHVTILIDNIFITNSFYVEIISNKKILWKSDLYFSSFTNRHYWRFQDK